ncbi:TPA: methyltransferase domain-containing protein [Proteus mirabilis]|nr:methyltransferase domain-containing protein [Proteus mirabilis]HEJ9440116.1 methyltransferase domain-containing protein [Proteus mirabilis]
MPINFHDEKNKSTYATRNAAQEWLDFISQQVTVNNKTIADIGCGGGIYSRAWASLGAKQVIGIDFSEHILKAAIEKSNNYPQLTFQKGDAEKTGLVTSSIDIVFERALIHHLTDYESNFKEIHRILTDDGYFIIQDRTLENITLPGNQRHLRGFFFECFPWLIDIEAKRRPTQKQVEDTLEKSGFKLISSQNFCETRQVYHSFNALEKDIQERTGRSILHELNDDDIALLIKTLKLHLADQTTILEQDYWNIWIAKKLP